MRSKLILKCAVIFCATRPIHTIIAPILLLSERRDNWNPAEGLETAFAKALLGPFVVDSLELEGNNAAERNLKISACFGSVVLAGMAGWIADSSGHGRKRIAQKATSYFVLAIIAISYVLLLPGLASNLFMFLMGAKVMGLKIIISQENFQPGQITESMLGFIHLLFQTGGWLGAGLVILYAIIVPAVKLVLIVLAELWRGSEDEAKAKAARRYIRFVKLVSKWACPDMFAYILLLYLFRHIDQAGGETVFTPSELGVGFACFSLFCICSTCATLAVNEAELEEKAEDHSPPMAFRWFGLARLFWVTVALLIIFSVLFLPGLFMPCFGMRLQKAAVMYPYGPVPKSAESIIDSLGIEGIVNDNVSMAQATKALARFILDGQLNELFAVTMLFVFAIVLPLLDMFVLVRISLHLSAQPPQLEEASKLVKVVEWLKHMSMMDVALMGILVISFAGAAYKHQGLILFLMPGIWVLLAAEVVHYFTYYLVHDAVLWRVKAA